MNILKVSLSILLIITFILANDTILIVTNEYAPYTLPGRKKSGDGVVLEIVREAFAIQGVTVMYRFVPWARCELMLKKGEAFGAVPYFKTKKREFQYHFSDPLIYSYNRFFYNLEKFPTGFSWKRLEDFQEFTMGGIIGYWYEEEFKKAGLTVQNVSSEEQNLAKLLMHRIDFTVIDELTGIRLLRKGFPKEMHKIAMLDRAESFQEFHIMISRTYPNAVELSRLFNTGLKKLKASKKYQAILERYEIPEHFAVP